MQLSMTTSLICLPLNKVLKLWTPLLFHCAWKTKCNISFSMQESGSILKAVMGESIGTLVNDEYTYYGNNAYFRKA